MKKAEMNGKAIDLWERLTKVSRFHYDEKIVPKDERIKLSKKKRIHKKRELMSSKGLILCYVYVHPELVETVKLLSRKLNKKFNENRRKENV